MRSLVALGMASTVALSLALFAGAKPLSENQAAHMAALDECAKACHECQRLCDSCSNHCADLVAKGNKEHIKTMQTCNDCSSFCAMTGRIVSTQGPFADLAVDGCATACKRCGDACAKFADDAQMKQCADECRRCERACREMANHTKSSK